MDNQRTGQDEAGVELMNEQALEAAAIAIFDNRQGSTLVIWEMLNQQEREDYIAQARSAIAAYHDAEVARLREENDRNLLLLKRYAVETGELRAKLADCQAFIRERGHTEMCPATACKHCFYRSSLGGHRHSDHKFEACERCTCGHDRTTGEKS